MQFEAGFQEIYHGVLMVDSNGYIVGCNKAAKELLGINGHVVGEMAKEVLPDSAMYEVLETGIPVINNKVDIGGRVILSNHKPILEGNKITGVVTSFQDITDLDAVAQELEVTKELNKELEAVFNSSYDEIFVTDGAGFTLRVNKASERFYGMKAEELIGKHVSKLEDLGLFSPSITPQVLRTKKRTTLIQSTKSGKKIIVTANPVFDEKGKIIRVVTNSRDITELSNLRQRLEDTEKLIDNYRTEIVKLRKERVYTSEIISKSAIMQKILILAAKVAAVDSTVLIEGESGVGKGVVALNIHQLSKRSEYPFITINCGAIPENLMESELFGYEGGSFTGAKKEGKKGLFEIASSGTIFLDEISELPLNLQVKLLQVIQDKRLRRVGGNDYIDVNARILAATNRNMSRLVKERKFREDLYYRLNVVPLNVPPLRHRKEDIPVLVEHFLEAFLEKYEIHKKIAPETLELLINYNWPGNVRELENLVERVVVTVDALVVLPMHLPDYILHADGSSAKVFILDICPLKIATDELERQLLNKALIKFQNTYKMADALEVNQSTIVRKMHRHGIFKDSIQLPINELDIN
ncbi:PAS domain S-box protein [Desulfosporosinus fructosivorans]|uniref:HTH-type transcriptional regulatory protein TyrR n=1 Tax=Desulfosporosinus fructosivorans TaxID=2018669 RepID=A0A4Z0R4H9_9FIRM|nr:sigma 54-interacting transcriptional regulator [Desulfosporosinus fructosivorans]TGE37720.1 PAS domain S-box protein [Desulfosporosinus fructosivorans]